MRIFDALLVAAVVILALLIFWGKGHAETFEQRIVRIAQAEIGHGESEGDNQGPDIRRYTGRDEATAWCAALVRFVLDRADYDIDEDMFTLRAKEIWAAGKRRGMEAKSPKPGDIICFWRKSPLAKSGHVGIVEQVTKDKVITIEGNVGKFPAKVKRVEYNRNHIPKLLGFIRVTYGL